jgi:hypothetical protein
MMTPDQMWWVVFKAVLAGEAVAIACVYTVRFGWHWLLSRPSVEYFGPEFIAACRLQEDMKKDG